MPRVQADLLMGFGGCTGLYPQPQATPEVSAVPAQHVACLDHLPRPSRSLLPQAHCYPEHIQHDGGRRGIGALLVAGNGNPPLTDWPSQTLAGRVMRYRVYSFDVHAGGRHVDFSREFHASCLHAVPHTVQQQLLTVAGEGATRAEVG